MLLKSSVYFLFIICILSLSHTTRRSKRLHGHESSIVRFQLVTSCSPPHYVVFEDKTWSFLFPSSQACSWSWVWCCTLLVGVQTRSSCTAAPTRPPTGPGSAPWAGPSTRPWAAPCSPSCAPSSLRRLRSPPPATRCRRRSRRGKASSASSEANPLCLLIKRRRRRGRRG